jgi:glycine cleavage system H protein
MDNKIKKLEIKTESMTYNFPLDRYYYTREPGHIWLKPDGEGFIIGIDDFSQAQGPILHIRVRPKGKIYPREKAFGTVETNKFIGPLRLPVSASIDEVNEEVINHPQLLNEDPYSNWIIKISATTSFKTEITSNDILPIGDQQKLEKYINSELIKYEDPPI